MHVSGKKICIGILLATGVAPQESTWFENAVNNLDEAVAHFGNDVEEALDQCGKEVGICFGYFFGNNIDESKEEEEMAEYDQYKYNQQAKKGHVRK